MRVVMVVTEEDGSKTSVRTWWVDTDGRYVRLDVDDEGEPHLMIGLRECNLFLRGEEQLNRVIQTVSLLTDEGNPLICWDRNG